MGRATRGSAKPKKKTEVKDNDLITSLTVTQSPLAQATEVNIDSDSDFDFELVASNFDNDTVEQLKKYPNVTTFSIHFNSFDCDDLLEALAIWKSKIQSLTIHITENRNFDFEESLDKWKVILTEAPKICTAIKCLYVEDANICSFVNNNPSSYLNSADQYFNIPKKLKFESLYFGLPLADFQSAFTQMKSGQFKKLTKLSIFNLSDVQLKASTPSFQLPQEVASNLTHYSSIQESFFESSTFRNLTFDSLTHLQIKTMLPLEKLFQLLDVNVTFPKLQYLSIDNRANLDYGVLFLGNKSLKRKVPDDERENRDFIPIFHQLTTLEIYHPPHVPLSVSWSQSFPKLDEMHLKTGRNEPIFCCHYCIESANYAECHKEFYKSIQELENVDVYYNGKSV